MEKLSGKNGTGRRGRPARRSLRHCSEWRLDGSGVTRHFDRLNAARGFTAAERCAKKARSGR
jgi:hypothetical protein